MSDCKCTKSLKEKNKTKRRARKAKYDSVSYLTGDIGLNINHFNKLIGTAETTDTSCENNSVEGGSALVEAKRYVRRYYIRPQNIFCSNKAEIIKALIELGDTNCSIYTLNNLGDEKDVTKLMNSDIIYYYDNGILFDKNKVKVMDYDLSIKKEENRKHFSNVDKAPNKEFKDAYSDRMTNATELEESLLIDAFDTCDYSVIDAGYTNDGEVIVTLNHNVEDVDAAATELGNCLAAFGIPVKDWYTNGSNVFIFELNTDSAFDQDFDDYTVFGEKLTESKEDFCCICGEPIEGYGNNPEPFMSSMSGQCCDGCNLKFVVPARLASIKEDE